MRWIPIVSCWLSRIRSIDVHADLNQRVVHDTVDLPWASSPMAGVERRMLDHCGAEVARAISIVRYAPGSCFERHSHGCGEEILVLDGIVHDDTAPIWLAAGYAIRPAAFNGPEVRRAARSGSRPATCRPPRGQMEQRRESGVSSKACSSRLDTRQSQELRCQKRPKQGLR